MLKLRLVIVTTVLMAALFVGGGVASAGMGWCEEGSPPPMDTNPAMVDTPSGNPHGMPTPSFKNQNGKFTDNSVAEGVNYLPPGMTQAAANKK